MKILAIETSADESAVSIVEATGEFPDATYTLLGNGLRSQIELHQKYGGIFPAMAKREHAKALCPLLKHALEEAELLTEEENNLSINQEETLAELLHREPAMLEAIQPIFTSFKKPEVDVIAVTAGPGLEPALWVGVNFAKALATIWNLPVVPVNHMEGHVLAAVYDTNRDEQLSELTFPSIALLVSGGHTELLLLKGWGEYEKIGQTRDDAVGEAFDKVARLLGLPYPGGPAISKLAQEARLKNLPPYKEQLPRPMHNSGDLDFSFSGLKTAVRYAVKDQTLNEEETKRIARDFEDAAIEVLVKKTADALVKHSASHIIVGGGVSANQHLRQNLQGYCIEHHPETEVHFPTPGLSTDNSIMVALAGHARVASALSADGSQIIKADGNKSLGDSV